MNLRRVSYRSVRTKGISDEELMTSLILPAAERNKREGITGCLWTGQYSFVQMIEGPEDAVHNLMCRIVADKRHHSMKMLMNCSSRARLFDTWSLKWVKGGQCVQVEGLAEAIAERVPKPKPVASVEPAVVKAAPEPSRMAQIVTALVSAPSGLP